jgi:tripartite-type tricarboxylate transporter receptor subunit TctC
VRDLKSLIALAKRKPEFFQYASAGAGTTTHMAGELFASMTGLRLTHIPYRGTAPSLTALMGGEVPLSFGSAATVPHIKAGKMVVIAVTGAQRSARFPQVPTIAESGLPGYEAVGWNALFVPAGTPASIVRRLNEAVVKGLKQPDAVTVFERRELELAVGTPDALATRVRTDFDKWAKIIESAGIERH